MDLPFVDTEYLKSERLFAIWERIFELEIKLHYVKIEHCIRYHSYIARIRKSVLHLKTKTEWQNVEPIRYDVIDV